MFKLDIVFSYDVEYFSKVETGEARNKKRCRIFISLPQAYSVEKKKKTIISCSAYFDIP